MKWEASAEQKKGEKHLNLQREELCCSGWSHCLCQGLLCSRLRKHIESESHFPEEFIVWKDKANRENWWSGLSWPVPEVQRCNPICCVIKALLGLAMALIRGRMWIGTGHISSQLYKLNRLCSAVRVKKGIMVFCAVRREYRHKWISAVGWDAYLHSLHSKERRRVY